MGSGPVSGSSSISSNSNSCCDMSLKCWCRWRWDHCFLSSTFAFFLCSFFLFGFVASFFVWLTFSPYERPALYSLGCQEDREGSWSIGIYYGDSPFSLEPIESKNVFKEETAAWPIANPVVTCASLSDAGFPSNFVADPFLFVQGDTLYLFYETKNSVTLQGDIGVAKSIDKGASWQQLGIALDEDWHLSYPYVFSYHDQIYMMPESSQKGELRLYRAINFPLQWTLDKVIMKRPIVDAVVINYNRNYWLLGSDHSGFSSKKNGELEIWYSSSPMGPWKPHKQNPIYNTDKSYGARNGGRPFIYNGNLYRIGQDCGESYGQRVHVFKVEVLNKDEYKEVEVPLGIEEAKKGRNAWNGARYHHLDVQQLSSGRWVGVMDGDRVPSGDSVHRLILGYVAFATVAVLTVLVGVLLGAVKCILPLSWCPHSSVKRSDSFSAWEWERSHLFSSKLTRFCTRMNRTSAFVRGRIKPNTCAGKSVLSVISVIWVALICVGVRYIYGGCGGEDSYPYKGSYSQFTLVTMTYDARLWNLKMYVKHYSRCSAVREIVVVWNKGQPPELSDLDSVVPVRIRVEQQNSLNNRFRVDPLIKTRAVLELDDDIMMTCDDIERGFKVWRENPDRIVGFYPRLINGSPLKYRDEKYARTHRGYNMVLTGAAFIDSEVAFKRYWSEEAKAGREVVDKYFNCEDVLMNFLYANASSSRTVEYVKPAWAIDTSKFSGAAISRNTQVHYQIRSNCLLKFSEMYGSLANWKWEFGGRRDGWDV
ncbi:glucosamine inositolphosphorylceramide transferase 1-like [Macadamia integrifolia]|uniref:glucosamine inositolphosphorylceramide transferase 1-like n=1 Tax=Macadamia integrifolia TaxID=60698 RepID=UPI001C52A9CC|nr:glucosamine inositolphosphorylceramide transferase 1-like [Macadamia integrifolia]XP_042479117.1 glucosamine inositolphosphorylceramide transferase 1-like [Macadamia integrifolia]XP_042479119.1 glucosamine inositolphosphorylceramide transferase 1-like [Macadamia integrifolia]